jgi:hypothetical protein
MMQPDTLPLVAYAYVCRLMHDSMHAGLLIHACMLVCMCPCPCLCVVSISSTARLLHGSVPLLCVLQHGMFCYIDFFPQ